MESTGEPAAHDHWCDMARCADLVVISADLYDKAPSETSTHNFREIDMITLACWLLENKISASRTFLLGDWGCNADAWRQSVEKRYGRDHIRSGAFEKKACDHAWSSFSVLSS